MTHRTLILVIRRLSERAREAETAHYGHPCVVCDEIAAKCRAKIDQLTERYS